MAKKKPLAPEQPMLIDTEHAASKPLKAAIRFYNTALSEKNAANGRVKKGREKILEIVKGAGIAPDLDGCLKFTMNGTLIKITPGESKLTIKEENVPGDDEGEEEAFD